MRQHALCKLVLGEGTPTAKDADVQHGSNVLARLQVPVLPARVVASGGKADPVPHAQDKHAELWGQTRLVCF